MVRRDLGFVFGAFASIGLLWAVAMPINAGPDEDQHLIWAASAARLQLEPEGPPGRETLAAPAVLYVDHCFQFDPTGSTAACQDGPRDAPAGDERSISRTQAPFYHWAVGVPSLLTSAWKTAYLMRLAHVVIVASLLTLGVWSMSASPRTPGSIAVATVAFTPMVAFLTGVVNPSGVAIAAGFAVWTGGLALATRDDEALAPRCAAVAIPALVFMVVRRDAILWLGPMLLILAAYAGRHRLRELARSRVVQLWAAAGVLSAGVSYLAWGESTRQSFASGGASTYAPAPSASVSFGELPDLLEQMIGRMGWLDVHLPTPVVIAWYGLVVLSAVLAVGASRRLGFAVAGVFLFTLVIPFVLGMERLNYYQGRYGLPLALGIPILAATGLSAGEGRRLVNVRMAVSIVWSVAVLSTVSFAVALRRFTVSSDGPWPEMLTDPTWSPPLPTPVVLLAHAALAAIIGVALSRLVRASAEHEIPAPSPQHTTP
jgi:hypothetical protein